VRYETESGDLGGKYVGVTDLGSARPEKENAHGDPQQQGEHYVVAP
jgi:hypothetical protein